MFLSSKTLKSKCWIWIALACCVGCSKQKDQASADSSGGVISTSAPSEGVKSSVFAAQKAPSGVPAQAPAKSETSAPVANAPVESKKFSSAGEVAQYLKGGGDRNIAIASIRELAQSNPGMLAEAAQLSKGSDADLALLGAHALSAIGTPEAATELLAALQSAQNGPLKRELCGALQAFTNAQAASVFWGVLGASGDQEVKSSAEVALGRMADANLTAEMVQRYRASNSAEEKDALLAALRQIQNAEAAGQLLGIINEQKAISSLDPLGLAAVDTLAVIGTPEAVSNLVSRLSAVAPGETSPIYDAIGRVSNTESLPLIAQAAYGQFAGSTAYSRLAAIQALGNFNSNAVYPVLSYLVQNDQSRSIQESAQTALKRIGVEGGR